MGKFDDIKIKETSDIKFDDVPEINTKEELQEFFEFLREYPHNYNTSCNAATYAMIAAFRYVGYKLGITGAQASFSALAIVGAINHYDGPYGIVRAENMLYPQYELPSEKAKEYEENWAEWASKEAKKKLEEYHADPYFEYENEETGETEKHSKVSPTVLAHWEKLAGIS